MNEISLEGMYDCHVHPSPSLQKRRFSALEAVGMGDKEKMAGILFLDHTYNTITMARTINEMGLGCKAFGSILLNEAVGGASPSVVEVALALGTRQIQMPTYSSKAHWDAYGDDQKTFPYKQRTKPVWILDEEGSLLDDVEEVLTLVSASDSFVGTGHLAPVEIDALVERARELKLKVVVNSVSTDMPGIPVEAQTKWANDHIFMEHDYLATTDVPHVTTPVQTIVEQIRAVGAERCVLGTDAGQMRLPDNVTSMKNFVGDLLEAGITEREIDLMTRVNLRALLESA